MPLPASKNLKTARSHLDALLVLCEDVRQKVRDDSLAYLQVANIEAESKRLQSHITEALKSKE